MVSSPRRLPEPIPVDPEIRWHNSTLHYHLVWRGMVILAGLGLLSWLRMREWLDWYWWFTTWQYPVSSSLAQWLAFNLAVLTYPRPPKGQDIEHPDINRGQLIGRLGIAVAIEVTLACVTPLPNFFSLFAIFVGLFMSLGLLLLEAIGYTIFRLKGMNQRPRIQVMRWFWLVALCCCCPGGLFLPIFFLGLGCFAKKTTPGIVDHWIQKFRNPIIYGTITVYLLFTIYSQLPADIAPQAMIAFWADRIGYSNSTILSDSGVSLPSSCPARSNGAINLIPPLQGIQLEGGGGYGYGAGNLRVNTDRGFLIFNEVVWKPTMTSSGKVLHYHTDNWLRIPILVDSCQVINPSI